MTYYMLYKVWCSVYIEGYNLFRRCTAWYEVDFETHVGRQGLGISCEMTTWVWRPLA